YTQQQLMTALAFTLAKFCTSHPETTDPHVLSALQALAETQKTLTTGIYYETQPTGLTSRELYAAVSAFLADIKEKVRQAGHPAPKEFALFPLLFFLYRLGLVRPNAPPPSRRFIEFLRSQFPQSPDTKREESRIIVP